MRAGGPAAEAFRGARLLPSATAEAPEEAMNFLRFMGDSISPWRSLGGSHAPWFAQKAPVWCGKMPKPPCNFHNLWKYWALKYGSRRARCCLSSQEDCMTDNETLTITDNRTQQSYTIPIYRGTVRAMDLRQIKTGPDDFGLMTYDPAFMNTASCQSAITYLDGDKGILRYRGYPIEQLAEKCTFLEVAYLLLFGELPTEEQLAYWNCEIMHHTLTHENVKKFMDGFHHDAHPMGILMSTVAALATFYPEAHNVADPKVRRKQIIRLIGKMPTLAAYAYRRRLGMPYVYPDPELGYTKNYMNMLRSEE